MASDPRVGERVYSEIKRAILGGELRLRQRLDIDALARRFSASATPVRQALAMLAAEQLVRVLPSRGYHVAFWSDRELRDLYVWRAQLARLALESFDPAAIAPLGAAQRGHGELYAAFMERLEVNANPELRRASRAADERLHAALRAEPEALADVGKESAALLAAARRADRRILGVRLRAYFRRRIVNSAVIRAHAHARAIPQNGE